MVCKYQAPLKGVELNVEAGKSYGYLLEDFLSCNVQREENILEH